MILIADVVDNKFNNDNAPEDQTHIAALGSDVEFRIKEPNGDLIGTLPVKPKRTVNVTSVIVSSNADIQGDLVDKAFRDLEAASAIFAQVGLEVNGTFQFVEEPAGVNLEDGLLLDTLGTLGTLSAEAIALLNAFGTPNSQDDIRAIYVDGEIITASTFSGKARGMAFPFGWDNGGNYEGVFLVSFGSENFNHGVWSHELGHILLNEHTHSNKEGNLMRSLVVYPDGDYEGNYVRDTKRLTIEQESKIWASKFVEDAE